MIDAATLQALAAAGAFVEQRISRGQDKAGEHEASEMIMRTVTQALAQKAPGVEEPILGTRGETGSVRTVKSSFQTW